MGLDFVGDIEALRQVNWAVEIAAATNPQVSTPDYYRVPFHAYANGNLSMDAALEVTVAAKSVHATVMNADGDAKVLDPEGDAKLRQSYSRCMVQLLTEQHDSEFEVDSVRDVLDLGAATGLSSLALLDTFPEASCIGLDLSPYFIAAGKYLQRQRWETATAAAGAPSLGDDDTSSNSDVEVKERLSLVHGLAEDTKFPDNSFDLVSMCLVCHELPEHATRAIFKEAARVLRPGGALAVMEMNPASPAFQKVMNNPIPYTIFKSTEPYLLDYVGLDMAAAMDLAGLQSPKQLENSPRHRTVVAVKKKVKGEEGR